MPLTNKKYVKRTSPYHSECPWCESEDIDFMETVFEGNAVTQEASCYACKKKWYDVYKLKGFVER